MSENGVGIPVDFVAAVCYDELPSNGSAAGYARDGWRS
jgi:hypothetical protein